MSLFLIMLAAGSGKRLKSVDPKPYCKVNNRSLLEHSLSAFKHFSNIKKTIVVYNVKHKKLLKKLKLKNTVNIIGGKTRKESVFNALKFIKKDKCKKVIIHDAARSNISKEIIKKTIFALKKNQAVVPVININDSAKITNGNFIINNANRDNLKLAQTPQGFDYKKLYELHYKYSRYFSDDDSALFTKNNEKVFVINGSKDNIKITTSNDLKNFKLLNYKKNFYGIGFDIHRLIKGKRLFLGGIKIPHSLGLEGHSDGDPVIHAIIDSLLGASGLGDIGKLFSNKDKKFKNIRSTILLKKTINILSKRNFLINNIDINIIAEKPKISKYSKKMKTLISKICKIKTFQINIKGKTTEKLGLIGKNKAIAAEVITSLIKYV